MVIDIQVPDSNPAAAMLADSADSATEQQFLRERLLLMGLAEGCRLLQPLARDQLITMDHVEPPPAGATARLRAEQDRCFPDSPAQPSSAEV